MNTIIITISIILWISYGIFTCYQRVLESIDDNDGINTLAFSDVVIILTLIIIAPLSLIYRIIIGIFKIPRKWY